MGKLLTMLTTVTMLLATAVMAEEDTGAEDTPLQTRAKAVLGEYSKATTEDAQIAIRTALLAKADTLETAGDDALASQCLERAGIVGYRLAEYDAAMEAWTRGLEVARRSGDMKRVAALLNAQAIGISITGDNDAAVALQTELIEVRRELDDTRGEGVSWHNLAYSYFALFRYPEAIDAISHALRLHRDAENAFGLAISMSMLSNALFEVGQTAEALAMADSAVARSRPLNNNSALGSALQGRARELHYAGRFEASLTDYEEAHEVLTAGGDDRVRSVSDINWANALLSLDRCEEARTVIVDARETLAPIGIPTEHVWGDCVYARMLARCGETDEARRALVATIDQLEAIRDSIPDEVSRADAFRMAGGAYTDLAILDINAGRAEDAWRAIESSTARLFSDELGMNDRVSLAELQGVLSAINAVAIQFGHSTVDRNVVCFITPTDVIAHPIAIFPGFRLDVASAMKLMSSGAANEECEAVLKRVSDVLLSSIAPNITGAGERLIVFPGGLAGFPIEALPIPGSDDAMGDRFSVTYAPSATAFIEIQARESVQTSVLVFADPTLRIDETGTDIAMRSARTSLAPLPEARAEGKFVGRNGTVLIGDDATRAAFLEQAGSAAVLHVAAHAVIDGTHPAHSGIVLAGTESNEMVTVGDLEKIEIHADLVSLSGCETAGGYVTTGDGAFGLTRAFLLAGARSVVSSLWDVEDSAGRRFMELYYGKLRAGEDRDVAMRDARIKMAAEGFTHRDRSAFILTGATAQPVLAVQGDSSGRFSVVGLGTAAVLLIVVVTTLRRRRA